jgi:hypothetical protein
MSFRFSSAKQVGELLGGGKLTVSLHDEKRKLAASLPQSKPPPPGAKKIFHNP